MTRSVVNRRIAIPSSPSSMNNSNYHHSTHGGVSVGSHCLQLGVIFIVISVLIIDGIAIFSYSNLFETTTVDNGVTRHLRQYEVQSTMVESEADDAYIKVASLSSSSSNVNEPKIVWLMSFPNSGTSYTSQLVRDTTHTVSASNYADETPSGQEGFLEPVYEDQIEGPFWIRPEDASIDYVEPTQYIITKTHCGMRCTLCPPEKYSETSYSFRRRCFTTKWVQEQDDGSFQRLFGEYKADRLAKAIHLVRNPFDNIVSRFHLDHAIEGRTASTFEKSRDGFRSYCHSIDTLYSSNEDRMHFLDKEILEMIRQVPCHEEFIRYVEWHNLAFSTADDLSLPTYVLHYEWYTTRFDATVTELLKFLGFNERVGDPVPFNPSVSYDYFTDEEKLALKHAYQMMSSAKAWTYIAPYFSTLIEDTSNLETI